MSQEGLIFELPIVTGVNIILMLKIKVQEYILRVHWRSELIIRQYSGSPVLWIFGIGLESEGLSFSLCAVLLPCPCP